MQKDLPPSVSISNSDASAPRAVFAGAWLVHLLSVRGVIGALRKQLTGIASNAQAEWDLTQLQALDHIGAQLLWQVWGKKRPARLLLTPNQESMFERLEQVTATAAALPKPRRQRWVRVVGLGNAVLDFGRHVVDFVALFGQLLMDVLKFARHPLRGPWREISANTYRTGAQALGITALVGCLIGVVLSYLSAQQLRAYGGDVFLVNLLGMSIVRELGPMLAAILVAGRSGSAITAQLGVMRVTEELDAMRVMGIPHSFRLVMPRVIALAVAMPLLVIWTDVMALLGGMAAAYVQLGMSPEFFVYKLRDVVPIANFWIGLAKGASFGVMIALIACHFGLRIKANTQSLGEGTTSSVVSAITVVIVLDAIFAIVFSKAGF
jgi:phospholipid/cholesterol/gamma-HCH transport system permease protein